MAPASPANRLSSASHRQPFMQLPSNQSVDQPSTAVPSDIEEDGATTAQLLPGEHSTSGADASQQRKSQRQKVENFSQAELRTVHTKQKYFSGRTVSLRFLAASVVLTFGLNLALLLYARAKAQLADGTYLVARGQCENIKALDTGLHAVINVLGILVLAAVGSYIAVLSAPTREDLNRFHGQGAWFEIGIPSLRNLKYVGFTKRWLCVALFFVSWPIHIIYNSIIYVHLTTTSYYWLIATQDFQNGAPFSLEGLPPNSYNAPLEYNPDYFNLYQYQQKVQQMQSDALTYTVLDASDCLKIYSNLYVSTFADVILVSPDTNRSNSLLAWDMTFSDTTSWLCAPVSGFEDIEAPSGTDVLCNFKHLEKHQQDWTSFGHPIKECLARPVTLDCTIEMSPSLMITVLITNGFLVLIMLITLTALRAKTDRSLTCFGDVLASYLQVEDEHSREMCLADRRRIEHFWRTRGQAAPLHTTARRWNQAMSRRRVRFVILLLCGGLIAVIICLAYTLYIVHSDRKLPITWTGLLELGFGSTSISEDLEMNLDGSSMASLSVLANIPQIFLAIITLMTNAAFVEMTQAAEYSSFSRSAKYLRVSKPIGMQRGTYLFSMPYKYAIPIQGITAALHWTVSQSIVPLQVSALTTDGSLPFDDVLDLAFSPLAIIASTIMAALLLISVLLYGLRNLTPPMPLASSCSLALSAATHPQQSLTSPLDPDAAYSEVHWGVTHYNEDGTGHCSFTSAKDLEVLDEHAFYR
ncbi:hypothetical protein H2200_001557 [Cladophialophora chaetospira]|uniref:DUF6536 domain-containing protein n=1 Tax=Cladophialophora chaetospira TaxID=386627 RepID=A0AA38XL42_9EURO|nr:hypothetical protein H2200_001557 [Cladophialophora chaetospira]